LLDDYALLPDLDQRADRLGRAIRAPAEQRAR
jgi:hypothetical protein